MREAKHGNSLEVAQERTQADVHVRLVPPDADVPAYRWSPPDDGEVKAPRVWVRGLGAAQVSGGFGRGGLARTHLFMLVNARNEGIWRR